MYMFMTRNHFGKRCFTRPSVLTACCAFRRMVKMVRQITASHVTVAIRFARTACPSFWMLIQVC